jgi:hypothetical protein
MRNTPQHVIAICRNGDPFGSGFEGRETTDGGKTWFYRGDVSPMPRRWWRDHAYRVGAVLRYVDF